MLDSTQSGFFDHKEESPGIEDPDKRGEISRRVDISWEVWCDGPQDFVFRNADVTKRVSSSNPWVKTFDAGWITQGNGTFCEVSVWVSHTEFSNTDGKIQVRMFAKY